MDQDQLNPYVANEGYVVRFPHKQQEFDLCSQTIMLDNYPEKQTPFLTSGSQRVASRFLHLGKLSQELLV